MAFGTASLSSANFVYIPYVWRGDIIPPLFLCYQGPYSRSKNFFIVEVGNRLDTISVDRFKPPLGAAPVISTDPPYFGRPPESSS